MPSGVWQLQSFAPYWYSLRKQILIIEEASRLVCLWNMFMSSVLDFQSSIQKYLQVVFYIPQFIYIDGYVPLFWVTKISQ